MRFASVDRGHRRARRRPSRPPPAHPAGRRPRRRRRLRGRGHRRDAPEREPASRAGPFPAGTPGRGDGWCATSSWPSSWAPGSRPSSASSTTAGRSGRAGSSSSSSCLAAFAVAFGRHHHLDQQPARLPRRRPGRPIRFATFGEPVTAASALVTTLWIVGMINSINFIDGLDGLSTGVALIAALTLGIISLSGNVGEYEPMVALLCAVLAGALAGFLPWNFHPARVFIGTTGRHGRGLRPRGALDPGHGQGRGRPAGPRRAHHRHLLDHHAPAAPADARRSRPTAATSTIACSTSA